MNVRVKRSNGNIDKVPLEDYVVGVLAGEMPTSFHIEALKAQAVAARTYVMKKMEYNINNDYDVVDTVMNQVYLDNNYLKDTWKDEYVNKINILKKAVLETYSEYITYNDEIIEALYFSTSTGKTENCKEIFESDLPYLKSVDSTWDNISPVYQESKYFTLNEFYQKLKMEYNSKVEVTYLNKTSTGRIKNLKINNIIKNASEITTNLGLRSTYFNISQINNIIKIDTKGYGHGVGMSQYGAEAMGKIGYSYDQIIKYYYQGVEIKKIV